MLNSLASLAKVDESSCANQLGICGFPFGLLIFFSRLILFLNRAYVLVGLVKSHVLPLFIIQSRISSKVELAGGVLDYISMVLYIIFEFSHTLLTRQCWIPSVLYECMASS